MKSFIYEKNLLNKLISLAQDAETKKNKPLKEKVLELLRNVKASKSPMQANSNPVLKDLSSLQAFHSWLESSNASYNGNLIISRDYKTKETDVDYKDDKNIKPPMNAEIDALGLKAFLQDLQQKTANDPSFHEAITDLINEANKVHLLEVKHVEFGTKPVTPGAVAPGTPAPAAPAAPGTPGTSTPGQPGPAAGQPGKVEPGQPINKSNFPDIRVLDGKTIDPDDIAKRITNLHSSIIEVSANSRLLQKLYANSGGISSSLAAYRAATPKNSSGEEIVCDIQHSSYVIMAPAIEHAFNKPGNPYTSIELAKIAESVYNFLMSVNHFYTTMSLAAEFTSFKSEIDGQMNIIRLYNDQLRYTVDHFKLRHSGGL